MYKMNSQIAFILAKDYNFDPRNNVKWEPHTSQPNTFYYTFANWRDKSNILIKFNPDELIHE